MLFGPKAALKSGDEITVTLCLVENDILEEVEIVMLVKKH